MNLGRIGACALAVAFAAVANAQTVYRWVDDSGRVHFGDVVPDAYRGKAERVDLKTSVPSAAEQADAKARADALKAKADAFVPPSQGDSETSAERAIPPPAQASAPFAYNAANCKAWRKRYASSKACFDGIARPNDVLPPGALQTCGEDVPNPYPVCGAPENYELDESDYPWAYVPPRHRH